MSEPFHKEGGGKTTSDSNNVPTDVRTQWKYLSSGVQNENQVENNEDEDEVQVVQSDNNNVQSTIQTKETSAKKPTLEQIKLNRHLSKLREWRT